METAPASNEAHNMLRNESAMRHSPKLPLGSSSSTLGSGEQTDIVSSGTVPVDDSPMGATAVQQGTTENDAVNEVEDSSLASPLSSVPDDLSLSRSASPEPAADSGKKRKQSREDNSHRKGNEPAGPSKKQRSQSTKSPKKKRKDNPSSWNKSKNGDGQEVQRMEPKGFTSAEDAAQTKPVDAKVDAETAATPFAMREQAANGADDPKHGDEQPVKAEASSDASLTSDAKPASAPAELDSPEDASPKDDVSTKEDQQQQWHREALEALTKIEIEFARLRDKMYREKMAELNAEAQMVADGTHPELVALMKKIEEKKEQRIKSAEAWRRHQRLNFQKQFQGLEYQANVTFIARSNELRRNLLQSLNEQRWRVDDEHAKLSEAAQMSESLYPNPYLLLNRKREQEAEADELRYVHAKAGFPRAPMASGLSSEEADQDLAELRASNMNMTNNHGG